jgi:hypothetical protein
MARRFLVAVIPALALLGCRASTPDTSLESALKKLTPDEVQTRIAANDGHTFVYDDNEKDRWAKGHVPGAKWLDPDHVTAADFPPDKGATLVFYCANEL